MIGVAKKIVRIAQEVDNRKKLIAKAFSNNTYSATTGIIFLKPEVCIMPSDKLLIFLKYFLNMLSIHSIHIKEIYILKGEALLKEDIFSKNYIGIKNGSKIKYTLKDSCIPLAYKNVLKENKCTEILGSLSLLKEGYSAKYLLDLWQKSKNIKKLKKDIYYISCQLLERRILLCNGFFPYQLEKYKNSSSKIIYLSFYTKNNLKDLKENFQGSYEGSLDHINTVRKHLFLFQHFYQSDKITSSTNGIHMSSSLKEGQNELKIFNELIHKNLEKSR